jgi:hypothetical protein
LKVCGQLVHDTAPDIGIAAGVHRKPVRRQELGRPEAGTGVSQPVYALTRVVGDRHLSMSQLALLPRLKFKQRRWARAALWRSAWRRLNKENDHDPLVLAAADRRIRAQMEL